MSAFSVHLLKEEITEAEHYIVKAMDVAPKSSHVLAGFAEICFLKEDYKQALKYYKKSIKHNWCKDDVRCWQQIAACHYYLDDIPKARVAASKMKDACVAEGIAPDDPRISEVYSLLEMSI